MAVARAILHYPGSKWRIAEWIVSHLPPHTTYLEPFFGSGAVFFSKPRSQVETINDLDDNVVNLFRVIRERPEELARTVAFTPWARVEFEDSRQRTGDPLEDARRFLAQAWMGRSGSIRWRTGWRHEIAGRQGFTCAGVWSGLPDRILAVAERLRGAQIEQQDALQLIARYRQPTVLIYADPPYPLGTRSSGSVYIHEMGDNDHNRLLDLLLDHPGPVVVSGYACDLYDQRLAEWRREAKHTYCDGGQKRQEVIWLNQVAARALPQGRLFGV